MTTAQVIITFIVFLVIAFTQLKLMFAYDKCVDKDKLTGKLAATITFSWIGSWVFIIFIFGIAILAQSRFNELSSNSPCPELEKLENVYRIK